jgi:hypothetical protein
MVTRSDRRHRFQSRHQHVQRRYAKTGAIYALAPSIAPAVGSWNTFEIEAAGRTITVRLNACKSWQLEDMAASLIRRKPTNQPARCGYDPDIEPDLLFFVNVETSAGADGVLEPMTC